MQRAPIRDSDIRPSRPLASARVLVIGVGGLGCPAALVLARAGVGTLGLIDPDRVEPSNLPRQLLFDDADVGRHKVDAAAERLGREAASVRVEPIAHRFGTADRAMLGGWDVVLDGTDSVATKFVVNDAAVATGVPLVHAGAIGWRGQLLTVLPGGSCYRCLFEEPPPPEDAPGCHEAGVLGPAVALAGALQAADALRVLGGAAPVFAGRLLAFDLATGRGRSVPVARRPGCTACEAGPDLPAMGRSLLR